MSAANIIFPNLRAEMARKSITVQAISKTIGAGRDTAGAKLSGKRPFLFSEAVAIADTFFPGEDIRYLFQSEKEKERAERSKALCQYPISET